MGLYKWILKNGIGSIGTIAKYWTDQYIKAKLLSTELESDEDIFASLISSFRFGLRVTGKKTSNLYSSLAIANLCDGHLDVLITLLILESEEHVIALHDNKKAFLVTIEIIAEITKEKTGISPIITNSDIITFLQQQLHSRYIISTFQL